MKDGVESMCNLSDALVEDALVRGEERGREIGEKRGIEIGEKTGEERERISSIRKIMQSLNLTAVKAMEVLQIPQSEYDRYLKQL